MTSQVSSHIPGRFGQNHQSQSQAMFTDDEMFAVIQATLTSEDEKPRKTSPGAGVAAWKGSRSQSG